jgi:protein-tyrosine phosphatase
MSAWFRTFGYASVYRGLIVGAMPLDEADVRVLASFGVRGVLNLTEDSEYGPGARRTVDLALQAAGIEERRLSSTDYGSLSPSLLEQATGIVNAWLDQGVIVYLHCRAGWQRSAAVAAGTIAVRERTDIDSALERVRTLKPTADPLPHQREDLARWLASRPSS